MRFVVGDLYFLLTHSGRDREMVLPEVESVIFIGKDVAIDEADEGRGWCFQDVGSYLVFGSAADKTEPTRSGEMHVFELQENQLETMIFDEDGLAEYLGKCGQRRRAMTHLRR